MKKYLALLLAAVMMLSLFAACALTEAPVAEGDAEPEGQVDAGEPVPSVSDAEELDLSAVAAEVGDVKITLAEVKAAYDSYVSYFSSYGYDVAGDVSFLTSVVETLAQAELIKVKAEEAGIADLTAEQQAELDSRVQTELDSLYEYFKAEAEAEAEADAAVDVEARTMELIVAEAAAVMGDPDATYDDYVAYITDTLLDTYLQELLEDEMLKDVTVPDSAVEAEYNALVEEQQTYFAESPEAYKFDQEAYEKSGTAPVAYVPEGYSRILHLFVPFEEALPEDYEANAADMEIIREEYGTLAIDVELGTAKDDAKAEMADLLKEYVNLMAANEAMYENHISAARAEAESLYEELQNGADFASLVKEKGGDDGYKGYDVYTEKGILIAKDLACDNDWSSEVKAQFAKLAVGEYSEAFVDDNGYHIIFYLGDEVSGNVALDAVAEDIRGYLLEDQRLAEWDALLGAWMSDGTVTYYPAVYEPLA